MKTSLLSFVGRCVRPRRFAVAPGLRRRAGAALLAGALTAGLVAPARAVFDSDTVTPSSVHLDELTYYSAPIFANMIMMCRDWQISGTTTTLNPTTGGLNAVGLPTATSASQVFTTFYGPKTDGDLSVIPGRWVVEWTGTGDVTLTGSGGDITLVSTTGAGATNGGERVYLYTGTSRPTVRVTGLTSAGLSSLKVWLPHPDAPTTCSLKPSERAAYNTANNITESAEAYYFSPVLIRVLKERPWAAIRVSKFTGTKDCVASNWNERRKPGHARQLGALFSRDPRTGVTPEVVNSATVYRDPGVAWEYAIALCNATGRNLWACVPHMGVLSYGNSSTDSYYHNLAKLIAYGSDENGNIYASDYQGTKAFKGLNTNLDVWVEYSNEVWNNNFDQYYFALNQTAGVTNPPQVAINSLKAWLAFETVPALKSDAVDRVVRLLGCQQVTPYNLEQSLNELYTSGKDGQVGYAEAVVTASYFGNSIEKYVLAAILEGAPHPLAGQKIYPDQQNSPVYPKYTYTPEAWARLANDAYFNKTFDEWTRRVLSGDANTGNGYDTTGYQGGLDPGIYTKAAARADQNGKALRVIATEGGASIYTDKLDNSSDDDDLITDFVTTFPYKQRMADLMRLHLELGRMRKLRAYSMFNLTGLFDRNGQWAMMDLDGKQDTADKAIRYRAVRAWFDEFSTIRQVDLRNGAAPAFTTAEDLGVFTVNTVLNLPITVTGATSVTTVGKIVVSGNPALTVTTSATGATITGKPTKPGLNFVFLRAMDADKDPAWRIYRFQVKDYAKNLYFSDLATQADPVSFLSYANHLISTEDGSAGLRVDPITAGATSKVLRVTAAVPVNLEYDTGTTDPLANRPFNFDTIKLGRGNTSIIGARLQGLSEGGNVVATEDIALSGAVNTVAEFVRDAKWDMLYSVKITFYSANNGTTITPAAGGILKDIKLNQ